MEEQEKLIDYINNPDNIKKAVEGSMEKRQAVIDSKQRKKVEYKELTHTRIAIESLDKAKVIVASGTKYRNVAHLIEVLVDREAKKIG